MKKIIIAIDGYSSCGKSTFAKAIAASLGYVFIDTGAMYRAVTLNAIKSGYINNGVIDNEKVVSSLESINISFVYNAEGEASDVCLNGENVEKDIRSIEVSNLVSGISAIKEVRAKLVAIQQKIGENKCVVMDGRDIGTTVFPDAEIKIFMTASVDVRAERRYKELTAKGDKVTLEEIKNNISSRDHMDETRTESPLRKANDAIVLDNSFMTIAEQMEWVAEILNARGYDN